MGGMETVVLVVFLTCIACGVLFSYKCFSKACGADTSGAEDAYVSLGLRVLPSRLQPPPAATTRARAAAAAREHVGGYRLEVAFKDASDGFNACVVCGFENFKRDPFCRLCAATIPSEHPRSRDSGTAMTAATTAAEPALGRLSDSFISGLTDVRRYLRRTATSDDNTVALLSKRQQRVRARREWQRRLDVGGALFWFRDGVVSGAADAAAALKHPGYTLQFRFTGSGRDPTPPLSAPSTTWSTGTSTEQWRRYPPSSTSAPVRPRKPVPLTPESVNATLQREVASHRLQLVKAAYATPGELAVTSPGDETQPQLSWADMVQLAAQDFPTKYAHFVSTTAALIAPRANEFVTISVSRASVLPDSMQYVSIIPLQFARSAMRIRFLDERGIDAGGLQREWFSLLSQQLADPGHGVFRCVNPAEQTFYLNPSSARDIGADHLLYYYGAGRLLGRMLLEDQVLGFHLALPLLKIMLGVPVCFSDLEHLDPEAYRSLVWIRDNSDVDSLGLTFSMTEQKQRSGRGPSAASSESTDQEATTTVVDLVENGRNVDVTDDNKHVYLDLRFRYTLFESVSSQLYAFLKGLYEVIPQELLMLFDPEEFDYLLCGSDAIDVDDWEQYATFTENLREHSARTWFWEIVREMPNEYRRRLLHFATGSSRVPIGGFSAMTSFDGQLSPFTLYGVSVQESEYIWGHACFNRLGLPLHESRDLLKQAIYSVLDLDVFGFSVE